MTTGLEGRCSIQLSYGRVVLLLSCTSTVLLQRRVLYTKVSEESEWLFMVCV